MSPPRRRERSFPHFFRANAPSPLSMADIATVLYELPIVTVQILRRTVHGRCIIQTFDNNMNNVAWRSLEGSSPGNSWIVDLSISTAREGSRGALSHSGIAGPDRQIALV